MFTHSPVKKLLLCCALLALLLGLCCASALAEESGTCGTLSWTLSDDGILTISGTGEMESFDYCTTDAWRGHRSAIKKVTIQNGVMSIGECAFNGCSSLSSITIPASVTSIGEGAFYSCSSLSSVTIQDGVTSIGDGVFFDCDSLSSITIPESVTGIGNCFFWRCRSLSSVTIPDSVTSIGCDAFRNCDSLTSATILNPDCVIGNSDYDVFLRAASGFVLHGWTGSTAEIYAASADGVTFESLGAFDSNAANVFYNK